MVVGRKPKWEQDCHAPIRVHGVEDSGGAPAPPPLKVSGSWYPKNRQIKEFSLLLHVGPGSTLKGASPGLGGGMNAVFCIVSCWQSVKIRQGFLKLRDFQCIECGSVPPPLSFHMLGRATR